MVMMASGIARGRVRTTTTTEHGGHTTNNMLAETCSLGLLCTSLVLDSHVMINVHLSKQGIR